MLLIATGSCAPTCLKNSTVTAVGVSVLVFGSSLITLGVVVIQYSTASAPGAPALFLTASYLEVATGLPSLYNTYEMLPYSASSMNPLILLITFEVVLSHAGKLVGTMRSAQL